jgi:hypothetical protein
MLREKVGRVYGVGCKRSLVLAGLTAVEFRKWNDHAFPELFLLPDNAQPVSMHSAKFETAVFQAFRREPSFPGFAAFTLSGKVSQLLQRPSGNFSGSTEV